MERGTYHPLDGTTTDEYLRGLAVQLDVKGEFLGQVPFADEKDYPRINRDPVIFVRNRTLGFAQALESIVRNVEQGNEVPSALQSICGIDPSASSVDTISATDDGTSAQGNVAPLDLDAVLLSKPANDEQRQIAARLDRDGAVLVQGPPGTGKTHTIANLIGHLLSQGKSVLVTSHTSKALRVVREQVVEPLRPLCVSVLDDGGDSRQQMEGAVSKIVEQLSSSDATAYDRRAENDNRTRTELLERLRRAQKDLLDACDAEFQPITVGAQDLLPGDAARRVGNAPAVVRWIPAPVALAKSLPLSIGELAELYRTNASLTPDEERQVNFSLPDVDLLPTPVVFDGLLKFKLSLSETDKKSFGDCWVRDVATTTPERLQELAERVRVAADGVGTGESWRLAAVEAGRQGGSSPTAWKNLIGKIEQVASDATKQEDAYLEHGPRLAENVDLAEQTRLLSEITEHLERGKALNKLTLMLHPKWGQFQNLCRIGDKTPQSLSDFRVLQAQVALDANRKELKERWQRQMTPLGAPDSKELGEHPEIFALQYTGILTTALDWYHQTWAALINEMQEVGFDWKRLTDQTAQRLTPNAELARMIEAAQMLFPKAVVARIATLRERQLNAQLANWEKVLEPFTRANQEEGLQNIASELYGAVRARDGKAYANDYERLVTLRAKQSDAALRRRLLSKLEVDAPAWAAQIRFRQEIHGHDLPPYNPEEAWNWRQMLDQLEKKAATSVADIQRQIADINNQIRVTTASLIENRAWAAQARRTSVTQRQALVGYTQIIKAMGKGTGKRVPRLQAEARKAMAEARPAVPVWIMPLSRVVESFDPATTKFDVVIIDEASQLDTMGLIALYFARQVVIVGDDEQVSPDAVGEKIDEVQQLIDERLQGVPNAVLYNGQQSIYDLALRSFGGTVCLREHFRCVADIIQFSNHLCYDGNIKPLRDASRVMLRPHIVAHRVTEGGAKIGKANEEEAQEIAALTVAMTEMPEYKDQSIGVMSLVGSEQVRRIETILHSKLTPAVHEHHQLVYRTPSEFQGDERDVILLSVVEAPGRAPLPIIDRERKPYRQRFNVAASRAKDQMWVVHSLDPATDLKPGDLRKRLIEHAQNPSAITSQLDEKTQAADSEFERQVIVDLVAKGYAVTPQYKVGAYRIDIVVEGTGARLAVECDGDRYHTRENLQADLERQALLERLGWTFVRIRGSVFFRDPQTALLPLYEKLTQMSIMPYAQAAASGERPIVSDLQARVTQRAAQLRREWRGDVDEVRLEESGEDFPTEPIVQMNAQQTPKFDDDSLSISENLVSFETEDKSAGKPEKTPVPRRVRVNGQEATLLECKAAEGLGGRLHYRVILDDMTEPKSFLSPPAQIVDLI